MFVYILQDNWRTIITYASGLYMLLIFGGQQYMSGRPRMEMRGALCLWNITLGIYVPEITQLFQLTTQLPTYPNLIRNFPSFYSLI